MVVTVHQLGLLKLAMNRMLQRVAGLAVTMVAMVAGTAHADPLSLAAMLAALRRARRRGRKGRRGGLRPSTRERADGPFDPMTLRGLGERGAYSVVADASVAPSPPIPL